MSSHRSRNCRMHSRRDSRQGQWADRGRQTCTNKQPTVPLSLRERAGVRVKSTDAYPSQGAVGVNAARSGTVMGFLFTNESERVEWAFGSVC